MPMTLTSSTVTADRTPGTTWEEEVMFKSKQRPLAIPQSEHQKLAGTLALLWGNDDFERPRVALESFLAGIGLHDRAYGSLDTLPIGELAEEDWLTLTRAGFNMSWSDPIADVIVKLHLKRLVSYMDSPARQTLVAEMAQAIELHLQRHGLDLATFERIDRITNLCDRIAFDFCFEAPSEGTVSIFPSNDRDQEVAVHYRIEGGTIQVAPWPFGPQSAVGYLVGYQLDGYPGVLEPSVLPYHLVPIA
jgi:hypothetical protein